ncbi:MAG: tRNA (adenosine(37)-N6)-dimethylallyltransferase MiaA [Nitrospirae bacterium]|nr:tRNA (adenosine(37)-N6)-dimethylallyltransferase MiaA [Nitrospirota bacterium]MBI5695810.1 tRNA (adenosine(37)-N6)-dimethylallyltransferase MiaA [Nitrospirota bacterium]
MQPLLIIIGPTAVGKTGLSLSLAEELGAEIISADSMQVYRGMDIGTAKPTAEERARVPHHLLDVADPRGEFSAGEFLRLAEAAIDDIRGRGRIPLVVGGTGLYIRALTDGLFEGPAADQRLRDELTEKERTGGAGTLYRLLAEADPDAAVRIHPADLRRIIRALEVFYNGGTTISGMHAEHRAAREDFPQRQVRIAGLTRDRAGLYSRIDARVDAMMESGFLDEVAGLREMGCTRGSASMLALGYKQLMSHLDGEVPLDEAVRLIKRDTRRFAKRQYTWFNADSRVRWVALDGLEEDVALDAVKNSLEIFGEMG